MKKLILLPILCLHLIWGNSQNRKNVLNDNFVDIVFSSNYEHLISEYTFLGGESYKWYVDNDHLFSDLSFQENDKYLIPSEINIAPNYKFFPLLKTDTTIQLHAKSGHLIYFDITFTKNKEKETFVISSSDNSYRKESNYIDGYLKSMFINRQDKRIVNQVDRVNDSVFRITKFNTYTGKYLKLENIYRNNLLVKSILYSPKKEKNSTVIDETMVINYDNLDRIISKFRLAANGRVKDSTKYTYEDSHLKSVIKYKNGEQSMVFLYYTNNNLTKTAYKDATYKTETIYTYDTNNNVKSIINDFSNSNFTRNTFYEYNHNSQVLSIKSYRFYKNSTITELTYQYLFTYSDKGILQKYIESDKDNNILLEMDYF